MPEPAHGDVRPGLPGPPAGAGGDRSPPDRPLSALPSRLARLLAFVAILVGGAAGGLIGYSLVDVQCDGSCDTSRALGAAIGALAAAAGTAVVAILVLRAMGEWREIQDREQ